MHANLDQLRQLSPSEKLVIVEALWDDIGASDEPIVVRPWQKEEASRRITELDADPSIAITRDELWKRVDASE